MVTKDIEKLAEYGEKYLITELGQDLVDTRASLIDYKKGKSNKEKVLLKLNLLKHSYELLKECVGQVEKYESRIKNIEDMLK